jgi:hypothetical protein
VLTPAAAACCHVVAGPGRDIITAGAQALAAGRPDMNSLVGLGASASFAVSCVAAALPALRWKTFFEEPAMLLGECGSCFEFVKRVMWGLNWCGNSECGGRSSMRSLPCCWVS